MALILIIDDDPDVVSVCRLLLERAGHEVISAGNVDDGRQLLRQRDPDLLVLDVMMDQPDDGIALARELRRREHGIPILMLTALGRVTGMEFARDEEIIPADEFIGKPINSSTFVDTVEGLLNV